MVRIRSDSFKWLFSGSRDVVHELVVEIPVQSVLRSRPIVCHQLHRSELGIEERRVVAVKVNSQLRTDNAF